MYLNLYEQNTTVRAPELDVEFTIKGDSVVRLCTDRDIADHIVIEVESGPCYLTDEAVQKLQAFLATWRALRAEGNNPTPERPVFDAGR